MFVLQNYKMKHCLLLFLMILNAYFLFAQIEIHGKILDKKGKPIVSANISIVDSYDGGITDHNGLFRFSTTEIGAHILVIVANRFDSLFVPINITSQAIQIDTSLKATKLEEDGVVVSSRGFILGGGKRNSVMNAQDIYTTGGANGDISSALRTLPGTQQLGEREGLAVRGGDVYETKQFIDGTLVSHPYFSGATNIPTRTRYPPNLFKDIAFSTGGYSALYGQALSSALILETIDIPEKSESNLSVTPLFWGGGLQKVAKDKKSSFGFDYSYTNVGLYFKVIKQTPDYFKMPQFHSSDWNYRIKTKGGGLIKYYGTFDYNQMGLRRQSVDSAIWKNAFDLKGTNWYHNVSWRQPFNNQWKMTLSAGFSLNKNNIWQQLQDSSNKEIVLPNAYWDTLQFNLKNKDLFAQTKLVLEKKWRHNNALRFGAEYWYNDYSLNYNIKQNQLKDNYIAAFAETDYYILPKLALEAGLRFENSSLMNTHELAPRAALAYKFSSSSQVNFAYGMFYQKPENNYLIYNSKLKMTQANHYIFTYLYTGKGTMLRLETYYKQYENLVKIYPNYTNNGNGFAKGIDVYWRDNNHTIKTLDYWITYSYVDTKRNYLNFPFSMQPNFVANHTANLVTKKFISPINTGISATYSFASGRPYYNLHLNSVGDANYSLLDQGKTKQYQTLNMSLYHLMKIGKGFGVLYASMTNVLNRNNVFGYNYSVNGLNSQPILPTAKRFYFIALFISWGVDRSQDTINNNL